MLPFDDEIEPDEEKTLEQVRCRFLAEDLGEISEPDPLFLELLESLSMSATRHAESIGASMRDLEFRILPQAYELLDKLRFALGDGDPNQERRLSRAFWQHDIPRYTPTRRSIPFMDRVAIEAVADDYLQLPYRSQAFDRTLLSVLMALEYWALVDEWLVRPSELSWLVRLILPKSPLRQRNEAGRHAKKVMDAARALYISAPMTGAISYKHVRNLADRASQDGLILPPATFALLDDLMDRAISNPDRGPNHPGG